VIFFNLSRWFSYSPSYVCTHWRLIHGVAGFTLTLHSALLDYYAAVVAARHALTIQILRVKAGVVCWQVKLCDPHLSALEVRFSRRGAIQINHLYLLPFRSRSFLERWASDIQVISAAQCTVNAGIWSRYIGPGHPHLPGLSASARCGLLAGPDRAIMWHPALS